jgi:hypothetical protein
MLKYWCSKLLMKLLKWYYENYDAWIGEVVLFLGWHDTESFNTKASNGPFVPALNERLINTEHWWKDNSEVRTEEAREQRVPLPLYLP